MRGDAASAKLVNQLEFVLGSESGRPDSVEGWQKLLASGGDVEAGRRVFFSSNSACNTCHVAEGRGGVLGTGFSTMPFGPDLSVIGRTANRQQIIESIVAPSRNIAPEMQGWMVRKKSGEVLTGRQIDQEARNIQLILLDGKEHNIPRDGNRVVGSDGRIPDAGRPAVGHVEGRVQGSGGVPRIVEVTKDR